MMQWRVKICGITNVHDAVAAANFGADAIGLNFYRRSLRCLTPEEAASIVAAIPPAISRIGVFVNAPITAREMGITVTETETADAEEYINLITLRIISTEMTSTVSGTIFGKNEARVVRINTFRLEMVPRGHLALIHNLDVPGSIGEIGTALGKHHINIGRMQVGQEEEGDRNIIFLETDTSIPEPVLEELRALRTVKTVTPLEF